MKPESSVSSSELAQELKVEDYVIRWAVEHDYIPLQSDGSISRTDADAIKEKWESSCFRAEAKKMLRRSGKGELRKVTDRQIGNLIRRDVLPTIQVLGGRKRILKEGVQAIIDSPDLINKKKVPHRWTKEDGQRLGRERVESGQTRKASLSKGKFLDQLKKHLPVIEVDSLLRPEAQGLFAVSSSTIWRWIAEGVLSLATDRNITLESILRFRREQQVEFKVIEEPSEHHRRATWEISIQHRVKKQRRLARENAKREALQKKADVKARRETLRHKPQSQSKKVNVISAKPASNPGPPKLVNYIPHNAAEREKIGPKKLVTCEEAARVSGRSADYWRDLCNSGAIRCERIGEQMFPFRHSVEIHLSRPRKTSKR